MSISLNRNRYKSESTLITIETPRKYRPHNDYG